MVSEWMQSSSYEKELSGAQAAVIQITRIGDARQAHPIPERVAGAHGRLRF